MTHRLRIGTLNIRNITDRWEERQPLLLAEFAALEPDLWGLQEVVYPVFEQDRLIAAASTANHYEVRRGPAGRPEYGNAVLVREPLASTLVADAPADHLDLGLERSAMSVEVTLSSGASLRFVATHLHHVVPALAERDEQTRLILDWLAERPPTDATVVVGDFNAEPSEPTYARMVAAGFRSSMLEANGSEPEVTWPTGIIASTMDTDGGPRCLDYVWLRGAIAVRAARLCFDVAPPGDPTIFPSDHRGIVVEVEIGEGLGRAT